MPRRKIDRQIDAAVREAPLLDMTATAASIAGPAIVVGTLATLALAQTRLDPGARETLVYGIVGGAGLLLKDRAPRIALGMTGVGLLGFTIGAMQMVGEALGGTFDGKNPAGVALPSRAG